MKILSLVLVVGVVLFLGSCMQDPPTTPADNNPLLKGRPDNPGGGGHTEVAGNNLSFPVLTADGYQVSDVPEVFTVAYSGEYPGLSAEQLTYVLNNGPWYPQKTEGNTWNAEFAPYSGLVFGVDWGDNIESVNPMLRRPFRIEVRLFCQVGVEGDEGDGMLGYEMAELEYPSSSNELQGTNQLTYQSDWATVVSTAPKFLIQFFGDEVPSGLDWTGTEWKTATQEFPEVPMSFGPELNVGGKYIWGGSQGGWKPTQTGFYRLTFYMNASEIDLSAAVPGNFVVNTFVPTVQGASTEGEDGEGGVAFPVVDIEHNLTYVDVEVVPGGGGGGGGGKGKEQ